MKAEFISDLNELINRKESKDRNAQPQSGTRMTRIARIFADQCVSSFIRVHTRFFKNRQTLSAKLVLSNYIRYLCHRLWQKFTPDENISKEYGRGFNDRKRWHIQNLFLSFPKVNALRSELLFSVIYLGTPRKVRNERKVISAAIVME